MGISWEACRPPYDNGYFESLSDSFKTSLRKLAFLSWRAWRERAVTFSGRSSLADEP